MKMLLCTAVIATSICCSEDHHNVFGDIPLVKTPVTSSAHNQTRVGEDGCYIVAIN